MRCGIHERSLEVSAIRSGPWARMHHMRNLAFLNRLTIAASFGRRPPIARLFRRQVRIRRTAEVRASAGCFPLVQLHVEPTAFLRWCPAWESNMSWRTMSLLLAAHTLVVIALVASIFVV